MNTRDNFPKANLPHSHYFLTLSRGQRMKTLAFRPWHLHAGFAILPIMMAWSVASGLYLGFHDKIMSSIVAQRTRMQLSYEDRLTSLRKQLELATSQQLVGQKQFESKLSNLTQRQSILETRASMIGALAHLVEGADVTGSISKPSLGSNLNSSGVSPNNRVIPTTPDPAFPTAVPAKPRPEAMLSTSPERPYEAADAKLDIGAQLRSLTSNQSLISFDQLKALARLEAPAQNKISRMRRAIQSAGLSTETLHPLWRQRGLGGPFVPLDSQTTSGAFGRETARLQSAVIEVAKLHTIVPFLPLGKPLRNNPTITSTFGPRVDPFLGRISVHPGIDFREQTGTPIHATGAGKVVVAEYYGGYGNMVEIDHGNGLHTRYGHLSQIDVHVGQLLKKGTELGLSGSTGRSTGPHLHYEVRQDGSAVNPARFLHAGRMLASND